MSARYAVHSHIGVYWDGGVRLLGIHRWRLAARIHCWIHVRIINPLRMGTVSEVRSDATLEVYHNSHKEWLAAMSAAKP